MRYLAGSLHLGLLYTQAEECKLEGFTDSGWGGSFEDRKSTSGMIFSIGSAAISWSSKKQEIIALSMTEAKYVAAVSATC